MRSVLSFLFLLIGKSVMLSRAESELSSFFDQSKDGIRSNNVLSSLDVLSERKSNEEKAFSLVHEEDISKRDLQTEQSQIVEVLDLGVDIPLMDDKVDVTGTTTFADQGTTVGSNGVTVTIENLSSNQSMQFLGLEILIRKSNIPFDIRIYVRDGDDMVNPLEQSSKEWTLIERKMADLSTGDKALRFVSVPLRKAHTIKANSALTVFVLVEQAPSVMISTEKSKQIVKTHVDGWMALKSGTSVHEHKNRPDNKWSSKRHSAFLGSIFCTLNDDENTSTASSVSSSPYTLNTMSVWEAGDVPTRTYGIVFDVYSSTGCNITSLDIHTPMTTYMAVEVYSMVITGTEDNDADKSWTLRSKTGVMGLGQTELTSIPPEQFKPLTLYPDTSASFFITTSQLEIVGKSTTNFVGSAVQGADTITKLEYKSMDSIQPISLDVLVGQTIVRYPVMGVKSKEGNKNDGIKANDVGSKSIFSGAIHFEPGIPQAAMNPELVSQLKLSIAGLSRRTLVRKLQSSSGGVMSNDAVRSYFEEIGRTFLNGMVNSKESDLAADLPPINIRKFVVSPEISDGDLEAGRRKRRTLWDRFLQGVVSTDEEEDNGTVPKLDVYATILGDYSPPPVVDFSALTENVFDEGGDLFLQELKSDPPPEVGDTFEEVVSIRAAQVTFPKPRSLFDDVSSTSLSEEDGEEEQLTSPVNFLIYVYVASAFGIGLLCCTVSVYMYRRNHKEQLNRKVHEKRDSMHREETAPQNANCAVIDHPNDPRFLREKEKILQQQEIMYDDRCNNQVGYSNNNNSMGRPPCFKGGSKATLVSSGVYSYLPPQDDDHLVPNAYPIPPQQPQDDPCTSSYLVRSNSNHMISSFVKNGEGHVERVPSWRQHSFRSPSGEVCVNQDEHVERIHSWRQQSFRSPSGVVCVNGDGHVERTYSWRQQSFRSPSGEVCVNGDGNVERTASWRQNSFNSATSGEGGGSRRPLRGASQRSLLGSTDRHSYHESLASADRRSSRELLASGDRRSSRESLASAGYLPSQRSFRRSYVSTTDYHSPYDGVDNGDHSAFMNGHTGYEEVPLGESTCTNPRIVDRSDAEDYQVEHREEEEANMMHENNIHHEHNTTEDTLKQADGRPSLEQCRYHSNNNDVLDNKEQKFWSVSGRHMLSRSGRRIWDAETGELKFDHSHEPQDEYEHEHEHLSAPQQEPFYHTDIGESEAGASPQPLHSSSHHDGISDDYNGEEDCEEVVSDDHEENEYHEAGAAPQRRGSTNMQSVGEYP